LTAALAAFAAVPPATASADYGPAQLLSGTAAQQFGSADAPAFAAGGRYVAFQGSLGGVTGIYRRDLQSGGVDLVAGADATDPALSAPDAASPSISADGRYVAFTTTADLDPGNEPAADAGCPEVYVRNMALPAVASSAYTLAAALNGTDAGIAFAGGCTSRFSGLPLAGAQAAPNVAISADGTKIAFTVLSASDLASAAGGAGAGTAATPPSQVVVRNLATKATTVVSLTPTGQPAPGGGAYPSSTTEGAGGGRAGIGVPHMGGVPTDSTAAISADGSTVAWMGTEVPAQVPSATDVVPGMAGLANTSDPAGQEIEPLWRRIADGTGATTKRLLGNAGLAFYANVWQWNAIDFSVAGGALSGGFAPPAISADGSEVAVVSNAPTPAGYAGVSRAGTQYTPLPADAYAVHVDDAPAGVPQATPVTQVPNYEANLADTWTVQDVAISPDGTQVAFDTARTAFTPFALISPPTVFDTTSLTYVANVTNATVQQVTQTYDGSPANGSAGLLAFSGDGRSLAVASAASNLFYGDVSPGASQVYLVRGTPNPDAVAPSSISPLPAGAAPSPPPWTLTASAYPQRDGTAVVDATVPGVGTLTATAGAQLAEINATKPRAKHAKPKRKKAQRASDGADAVPAQTVASARRGTAAAGTVALTLTVARGYRSLVADGDGLYAIVKLSFTAAGRDALSAQLPVTFRAQSIAKTKRRGKRKPAHKRGRRR
jgi:Tol biopolymer transport system component